MLQNKLQYPPKPCGLGPILAISGPHGSGKSTCAKKLAKSLGIQYISAGEIFREYAKQHQMSIEELSKQILDEPKLDIEIDQATIKKALSGKVIIDATLSAWVLEPYADLKILITAPLDERV